jgi:antitoxin (DNA-binding transcriptional repressor) of toxin-antitoxin stability system
MHIPLGDNAFSRAVRDTLAKHGRPVLALVGHRHTDAVEDVAAGRSFVQVRTAIFARAGSRGRNIRLLEDRMEVCATGDTTRIVRTISVRR